MGSGERDRDRERESIHQTPPGSIELAATYMYMIVFVMESYGSIKLTNLMPQKMINTQKCRKVTSNYTTYAQALYMYIHILIKHHNYIV